jgi:Right handed beta helix region
MVLKLPLLLSAAALLATAAHAGTVHVPGDHPTIQEGITFTADGDTLVIGPGTYNESLTVDDKNAIRIKASPKALVNPLGSDAGLTITDSRDIQVIGLHIADGGGPGIVIDNCVVVTLQKCDIENVAEDAIHATGTLNLTVDHCRLVGFAFNGIDAAGFGADEDDDDTVITRCIIDGTGGATYGIIQKGDNARIEKNQIVMDQGQTAINLGFTDRFLAHVRNNKVTGDLRITRAVAFSEHNSVQKGQLDFQGPVLRSSHDSVVDGQLTLENNSNMIVSDAKVSGPDNEGVLVNTNDVELDRLTVTDSNTTGVLMLASFFVALEQAKISNCAQGVVIDSNSKAAVIGCKVTGSGSIGLDVQGPESNITGNHVTGSGTLGIHLGAISHDNVLSKNVVKGSGDFDLQDDSGGANTIDADNVFGTVAP